jgi:hypothetical protein
MLSTIHAVDRRDSITMNGLPNYWEDLNHRQEDVAPTPLSLLDPNMQMAVWIPLYSPHASAAPVLFQRASTVPTPVCDG